jgi:hypothetical protein
MIWMYAGLSVVSLFVAWLIVTMFMTENGERKRGAFIVFLCVFAAVSGFGRSAVLPRIEATYQAKQIDEALQRNPGFAALKTYDAAGYASLISTLKQSAAAGSSQQQVVAAGTNVAFGILMKKVVQASDEAALQFMSGYSQILNTLQDKDLLACYHLGHPEAGITVDITKFVSPEQLQAQHLAMAEVIRTASTSPQAAPFDSEMKPLIEPIATELIRLYGADVLMLMSNNSGNASGRGAILTSASRPLDKRRICQMEAA